MRAATGAGTASRTREKQPGGLERARVVEQAAAFSAERPWALKPPSIVADCGVSPMWPMTGIPAATIARTRESITPAPSSFTASAPASFTNRIALRTASSSETWNEPNGMSAMTSGLDAPRVTARVRISISSIVAGTVESWPSTVIAAESPTSTRSDAGLVGEAPAGRVVRRDHDDRLPPRLHLGELGEGELPGRGRGGRGLLGRMLIPFSFEDDVVDETGGADADGAGEDGRVEVRDLDVVDLETVRRCELGERALAVARRQRSRERERAPALVRREERVARREGEAVRVADGRNDAELDLEREVADQRPDHLDLLRVLLAEVRARRADDREELEHDRRDAAEVARGGTVLRGSSRARSRRPTSGSRADTSRRGRGEDEVDAGLAGELEVARLVARVAGEVGLSANCAGLTNRLMTTVSLSARAARSSARCPSWSAPIVGTSPIDPARSGASASRARRSCGSTFMAGPHCGSRPASARSPRRGRGRAPRARAARRGSRRGAARPSPSRRARSARSARSRCP